MDSEMDLEGKTRDELMAMAKEAGLKPHHKSGEKRLKEMLQGPPPEVTTIDKAELKEEELDGYAEVERRMRMEEEVRDKLRLEAEIRTGIAEVKAKAQLAHVTTLDIPAEPTLTDVLRLKTELGLEVKKPKPSPETLAILASKKMYYRFINLEQEDVDIQHNVGGKHHFHHFHGHLSVLPDYLVTFFREHCTTPVFEQRPNPSGDGEVSMHTGDKQRFMLEPFGEAPEDAKYGVVLDPEILEKFGLGPIKKAV